MGVRPTIRPVTHCALHFSYALLRSFIIFDRNIEMEKQAFASSFCSYFPFTRFLAVFLLCTITPTCFEMYL